MNNKGFTVVELIAAFSITMVISVFLFELLLEVKTIFVDTALKTNIEEKTAIISKNINNLFTEEGNTVSCSSTSSCSINGKSISISHTDAVNKSDYVIINNQKFAMPEDGADHVKITDVNFTSTIQGNEGFLIIRFLLRSPNLSKPYNYNVVYYYN